MEVQIPRSGQQQIALGVVNISRSAELTAVDPNHLHLAAYADGLDWYNLPSGIQMNVSDCFHCCFSLHEHAYAAM